MLKSFIKFANRSCSTSTTQALLYDLGAAMVYFPIVTLIPLHFTTHRGLALGTIMSGAGFGGLVLAPILRTLISGVGVR